MLSIRLKPELEARLMERAKREGVTKSAFVSRLLARELAPGDARHPVDIIEELTAGLEGSGNPHNSENISRRLKEMLRAKHNR